MMLGAMVFYYVVKGSEASGWLRTMEHLLLHGGFLIELNEFELFGKIEIFFMNNNRTTDCNSTSANNAVTFLA